MTIELRSRIEKQILEDENMNRGSELRMSGAGDCVLKLSREMTEGKSRPSIDGALRMNIGNPIHDYFRKVMESEFGSDYQFAEELIGLPLEVDGEEYMIPGHADGVLASIDAVVEFKSCSDSTFSMVKNQNKPLTPHIEQGNAYAGALCKKQVLFVYINRNSGEFLLLVEPFNPEMLLGTLDKWRVVTRSMKSKVLPPRPYQDMTCSPCWYCEFKESCYENYKEEVAKMGARAFTEGTLVDITSEYQNNRLSRLSIEKTEEKLKSAIALLMIDSGLNEVSVPAGLVTLKVGKSNNPLVSIKEKK